MGILKGGPEQLRRLWTATEYKRHSWSHILMANGIDCELDSAYLTILYNNGFASSMIKLRNKWLVVSINKTWPWLILDRIDVRGNVLDCVRDHMENMVSSIVVEVKPTIEEVQLEKEIVSSLPLAKWYYCTC